MVPKEEMLEATAAPVAANGGSMMGGAAHAGSTRLTLRIEAPHNR